MGLEKCTDCPLIDDVTAVGLVHTRKNLYQRGLPRAVFAQKCVGLTREQGYGAINQRLDGAEEFGRTVHH